MARKDSLKKPALLIGTALVVAACAMPFLRTSPETGPGVCPAPEPLGFQRDSVIRRDVRGLTQGLLFSDGMLFESTGRLSGHGSPVVNRIDPRTGKVTHLIDVPRQGFGEGLARIGKSLFQLTYREGVLHEYESDGTPAGTRLMRTVRHPLETGWGLTTDGKRLIASDGSATLFGIDPGTLEIRDRIEVRQQREELRGLNELEFVDGQIFANVFQTGDIVRIDSKTGCVTGQLNLDAIWEELGCPSAELECSGQAVLNGIAYDPGAKVFYFTGKSWPVIHRGRVVPSPQK